MRKKPIIIAASLGVCSIIWLIVAIVVPIVLDKALRDQIEDSVIMKESDSDDWAQIPGSFKDVLLHEYHIFNVQNPDDIISGAVPVIEEKNGYTYQEYDDYFDREYTKHSGESKAWVHFWPLQYLKKTHHCKWHNNTSPDDVITTVNLGPFFAWDTLKRLPPEQVSVSAMYQLALGFNGDLYVAAHTQALSQLLLSYEFVDLAIFKPAGLSEEESQAVWNDERFGWGNWVTLQVWVKAYQENLVNGKYVSPGYPNRSLYLLKEYFGLSTQELDLIFGEEFANLYDAGTIIVHNMFDCTEVPCDPVYLGGLQWSQSGVSPPSIVSQNSTAFGFPEIKYFLEQTNMGQKYPNVEFTPQDYKNLFFYNVTTGWPSYNPTNLMDIGKMTMFYEMGRAQNFTDIASAFALASEDHARVLWGYVNTLVSKTALIGRTDPSIYNQNNRGITSELGIGTLISQGLYGLYMQLADVLLLDITSKYAVSDIFHVQNTDCETLVGGVQADLKYLCDLEEFSWVWDKSDHINFWIQTYWEGQGSEVWEEFQGMGGLTDQDMATLFAEGNVLTTLFAKYDSDIKAHYKCSGIAQRCFKWDFAAMQWGYSGISNNVPDIFSKINIKNSVSVMGLGLPYNVTLPGEPEYNAFASKNKADPLTPDQVKLLLSFDSILNASMAQLLFIYDFEGNTEALKTITTLSDPQILLNYLRYAVDKFAFGGLFVKKTVDEFLFTGVDPFLENLRTTNPLAGGDPSMDPTQVRLGQNQTREQWHYVPKEFKHAMNTGRKKIDEVRWYRLFFGQPYLNILGKQYKGEGPNGPIVEYVNKNPWNGKAELKGSDAWNMQPDLGKHDTVWLLLDTLARNLRLKYWKTTTKRGFTCYRYRVTEDNLYNVTQNPEFDLFFTYSPMGVVNMTGVFGGPVFAAKPYFYQADPTIQELVTYTRPDLNVPKNYETYIDIEPYTGGAFKLQEQMMFTVELKPDVLYNKLGSQNLQKYGYRTYMPFFWLDKVEEFSQSVVDDKFGAVKTVLLIIDLAQAIGYSLFAVILVALAIYLLNLWIDKRRRKKHESTLLQELDKH